MAYRVLRAVAWVIFSVLLVLLVPSSAWSATGGLGSSAASRLSSDHCGTSPDEPGPEIPHVCVTATATETTTATATATATETATVESTVTVTETVVEQGEPTCGSGDLPPCAVSLDEGEDPWIKVTGALLVSLAAATLATLWGKR